MVVWNKVTWYSKLLAVLVLLVLFPALTFYIGMRYEEVQLLTMSDTRYTINNQAVDEAAFQALKSTLTLDTAKQISGEDAHGGGFTSIPAHDAGGKWYLYKARFGSGEQSESIDMLPS